MKKLRKIPLPQTDTGLRVQCPYHHPAYFTAEHAECRKKYDKEAKKNLQNSLQYKQIEVLNELIEYLNTHK